MNHNQVEKRFIAWAEANDNIRAAIVIGSRARHDHPADEWSDLDILIFARDPRPLWQTDWLHHIGDPWLSFIEPTADGEGYERRVLFDPGLDVDLVPIPVASLSEMIAEGFPADVADMIQRGACFLIDKDGFGAQIVALEIAPPAYAPPDEKEFLNLVNDFWFHTVWTAKHLRRGEIWWAKGCCDGYLKALLRRLLEWHARATKGSDTDTWMRGRFLEEWADPRAVEELPAIYAHYDEEDIWYALKTTMELFGWLARETADLLGYSYPTTAEAKTTEFVRGLNAGRIFSSREK